MKNRTIRARQEEKKKRNREKQEEKNRRKEVDQEKIKRTLERQKKERRTQTRRERKLINQKKKQSCRREKRGLSVICPPCTRLGYFLWREVANFSPLLPRFFQGSIQIPVFIVF